MLRARLTILIILLSFVVCHAQDKEKIKCDSLFAVMDAMPGDSVKVVFVNKIYAEYLWQFDLPESYKHLKECSRIAEELRNDTLQHLTYRSMAAYCNRAGAQDYAMMNNQLALEAAERMSDSTAITAVWGGIAKTLEMQGLWELSNEYYRKCIPYQMKQGNLDRVGRCHTFMGWNYDRLGKRDSAIYYCELGLDERRKAGDELGVLSVNASLVGMYMQEKRYDDVRERMQESIYIHDTLGDPIAVQTFWNWMGSLHEAQGNSDSALWYYRSGVALSDSMNNPGMKVAYYKLYSDLLAKLGRKDEAYDYYHRFVEIQDSLRVVKDKNDKARSLEIYDIENKNKKLEELQEQTERQQLEAAEKDRQRIWFIAVIAITSALVIVALFAYRSKQRSAALLAKQKDIIEEKNRDITDSIVYAKRIQQALLPSLSEIKKALPESFVFFRPKDIVSGDFFWFNETPWSYYLAAVDCTGHGVPGAMMSMIGYNFLGEIVNEQDVEQPAEILNELHKKVLLALNKDLTTREIKDGMDVALIRIDKKTGKIYFSGAVRPLYIVHNGELTTVKGDIYSVGGIKDVNESFTQHEIEAPEGTCLYLFSDGIADQFGGPKGKKYKYKQLKELLVKNAERPMDEQLSAVERSFDGWKGPHEQVDDVCVVGLRITSG